MSQSTTDKVTRYLVANINNSYFTIEDVIASAEQRPNPLQREIGKLYRNLTEYVATREELESIQLTNSKDIPQFLLNMKVGA